MKKSLILFFTLIITVQVFAGKSNLEKIVKPRMRVIIVNDFGGDPDGLVQLAHHLLCGSTEITAIIGSHLTDRTSFDRSVGSVELACRKAGEVVSLLGMQDRVPVLPGAETGMTDPGEPVDSPGARKIIAEALRTDTDMPLYVVCGSGLTDVASAWLMEPSIAGRFTLVWIGGPEYEGMAFPPPGYSEVEYNVSICIPAVQTVFNLSDIPLWQVPRNAYRQCIYSFDEIQNRIKPAGPAGAYLARSLEEVTDNMNRWGNPMGETYILGDSPLVLLTSLQSNWEPDPSSSLYRLVPAPEVDENGQFLENPGGRLIRVYDRLDLRLMFGDMEAKLEALCRGASAQGGNPFITHMYTADPSARVFNDTLFVYPSHDEDDAVNFSMKDWHVFSTTDMEHWTDHGAGFSLDGISWASSRAWAPDCIQRHGKYYFYYPVEAAKIGVAVADTPYGPFRDPLDSALIHIQSKGVVCSRDFIDPAVFIDDDGQAYLYMGQLVVNAIKLNRDMISYDGQVHLLEGTDDFFEAVWMHKYNGMYYLSYAAEKSGEIKYCTSDNPLGPFTYRGVILQPMNSGTNHHSIVEYNGEWYLFYHNSDLYYRNHPDSIEKFGWGYPGSPHPFRRSICFDKLYYNEDGTIQKVVPTK
ncbi:MAG: family 43 glycosylhydrolase [Bacteroidales bacterium]